MKRIIVFCAILLIGFPVSKAQLPFDFQTDSPGYFYPSQDVDIVKELELFSRPIWISFFLRNYSANLLKPNLLSILQTP
jgi:hypothetical protein